MIQTTIFCQRPFTDYIVEIKSQIVTMNFNLLIYHFSYMSSMKIQRSGL